MDPNLEGTRSTEETTQTHTPAGSQTATTRRTESGTQVAQDVATTSSGPGGAAVRREQTIGPTVEAAHEYSTKKGMFRAYQVLWYVLGLLEILLAFRFFFKLTGANPDSGFVNMIYSMTDVFAGPFLTIFSASPNEGAETTSYFEWSTLVAAAVYALIVWGIIKLFQLGKPTTPEEVDRTLSQT